MSYKVYPVIKCEPECNDYSIKINGTEVEYNTARVSAYPFNRRWPGHQRDISQSEPIQFLSLECDEELHFEITPRDSFDRAAVKIRPTSLGITPRVTEDGRILFTLPRAAYFTVEAYGRNRALHIFADEVKDYGITKTDNNVIYFGKGEHDAGLIELHSGQTLFIDEGAVVYACVRATDAENIRIAGNGILDNSRNKEKIHFKANAVANTAAINNATRENTIKLEYCTNILIEGITIRDSLLYNIRPIGCQNLTVKNVKIIGCWRYNSDGVDMHNCTNVLVQGCFIRTFDDSVCIKGFDFFYLDNVEEALRKATYRNGKVYDSFKNAVIEKCVIWNDWGKCLEIGAETKAEDISDITFRDCDIIHITNNVLDCMNVDYADVHDVKFSNIRVEADETIPAPLLQQSDDEVYRNTDTDYMPDLIRVEVVNHPEYSKGSHRRGKNRDITFEDVYVYGNHPIRASFLGYDEEHMTENILIKNLHHNGKAVAKIPQENLSIGDFVRGVKIESDKEK